jgi:hypothetical protein
MQKIEKYAKQESIILKDLGILNNSENQNMFQENDMEIIKKYEVIKKEWQEKKILHDKFKRIMEIQHDFDYFADIAQF